MNWEAIGAIAEALAAIGVMITLAYLAVQIRQNTRSQLTETYGRALDRVTTLQGRISENAELASILLRGALSPQILSPTERTRFTWIFYEMFSSFEFIFHQAQRKAIPAAVWQRWADTLRWWMSFPGVQEWWDVHPTPFTPDFTRFVDEQGRTGLPDPAAHERWMRYLQLEEQTLRSRLT